MSYVEAMFTPWSTRIVNPPDVHALAGRIVAWCWSLRWWARTVDAIADRVVARCELLRHGARRAFKADRSWIGYGRGQEKWYGGKRGGQ